MQSFCDFVNKILLHQPKFSFVFFCQVVEIKLQFDIYEKRLKALSLQRASAKGRSREQLQKQNSLYVFHIMNISLFNKTQLI